MESTSTLVIWLKRNLKPLFGRLLVVCALFFDSTCSGAEPLDLPLASNNYARISDSASVSRFLHTLADRYPHLARVDVAGRSVQFRPIEVLRISTDNYSGTRKLRVLLVGSQHGAAEPAGGEALLVIARELLAGQLRALLDHLDILILPNANPDGRDRSTRSNANGVNINTDFVRLSQPETRVLKQILHQYAPDAVLDCHESAVLKRKTLAREGYLTDFDAQFEYSNHPAVPAVLSHHARDVFLPAVLARVSESGLPAQRYIGEITSINQPITNGGLTLQNFRNTAGLTGALSFLVETRLDSKLRSYATYQNIAARVERQIVCIRSFLAELFSQRAVVAKLIQKARSTVQKEAVTMFASYEKDSDHPTVKIPLRTIVDGQLVEREFSDHRAIVTADRVPYVEKIVITNYIDKIRPLLERHGIAFSQSTTTSNEQVIAYRFERPRHLGTRIKLLGETKKAIAIRAGALIVNSRQENGRLAMLLLDPRSTSSIFRNPEFADLFDTSNEFFVYYLAAAETEKSNAGGLRFRRTSPL